MGFACRRMIWSMGAGAAPAPGATIRTGISWSSGKTGAESPDHRLPNLGSRYPSMKADVTRRGVAGDESLDASNPCLSARIVEMNQIVARRIECVYLPASRPSLSAEWYVRHLG